MKDAKIYYTVNNDKSITVQLLSSNEKLTKSSVNVKRNADDYTLEIVTAHENSAGSDILNIHTVLVESDATDSKPMIIDWRSREDIDGDGTGDGPIAKVKRRKTTTTVTQGGGGMGTGSAE